jgi:hypothetical protein
MAANELERLGPEAKSATPRLVESLNDRNPNVRVVAAQILSRIDPDRYPRKN